MADPTHSSGVSLAELAGYAVGGVVALAAGWRRLLRGWSADRTATVKSDAEADVVALLRAEVERLGEQNGKLAEFANQLQGKVLELQQANLKLQETVTNLHAEVQRLRRGALPASP